MTHHHTLPLIPLPSGEGEDRKKPAREPNSLGFSDLLRARLDRFRARHDLWRVSTDRQPGRRRHFPCRRQLFLCRRRLFLCRRQLSLCRRQLSLCRRQHFRCRRQHFLCRRRLFRENTHPRVLKPHIYWARPSIAPPTGAIDHFCIPSYRAFHHAPLTPGFIIYPIYDSRFTSSGCLLPTVH